MLLASEWIEQTICHADISNLECDKPWAVKQALMTRKGKIYAHFIQAWTMK